MICMQQLRCQKSIFFWLSPLFVFQSVYCLSFLSLLEVLSKLEFTPQSSFDDKVPSQQNDAEIIIESSVPLDNHVKTVNHLNGSSFYQVGSSFPIRYSQWKSKLPLDAQVINISGLINELRFGDEAKLLTIVIKNTGSLTWGKLGSKQVVLGTNCCPRDNAHVTFSRISPVESSVPPGQYATFPIQLKFRSRDVCHKGYAIIFFRLLTDDKKWFGDDTEIMIIRCIDLEPNISGDRDKNVPLVKSQGKIGLAHKGRPNCLHVGSTIFGSVHCLHSASSRFRLCERRDGSMCIRDVESESEWCHPSSQHDSHNANVTKRVILVLQTDGNLVLRPKGSNEAVWSAGVLSTSPSHAILQDDGNLLLYDNKGFPYWNCHDALGCPITSACSDDKCSVCYNKVPKRNVVLSPSKLEPTGLHYAPGSVFLLASGEHAYVLNASLVLIGETNDCPAIFQNVYDAMTLEVIPDSFN